MEKNIKMFENNSDIKEKDIRPEEPREYYLDNIRWLFILLLIPFHSAMCWNTWESNYIWFSEDKVISSFIIFISPFYMPVLFVIAGMSICHSLKKRTYKEFVKERFLKLFLPLITCILVIAPILSFYADKFHNGYVGNFFEHYYVFFTRYTDLTGYDGGWTPAHLWFLLYLFCFSLIGVLIIALQRRFFQKLNSEPFKEKPMITRVIFLYSLALFPIILNPIIDVLSYFSLFLIGYYVISKKSIMDCIVKFRFLHLIILIIVSAIDVYMFIWIESSNSIINSVFMSLTCWFGILTVLGISKTYFNQKNKLTTYLSSRSFLFYIFHFIWLVIFGYYMSKVTSNIALLFIIPVIASYIITFINIELVIKIPVINFLFGVHSKK